MVRFWILAGYFIMMSFLQVTGRITQYINPHYQYLTKLTMGLSLLLALFQLVKCLREERELTTPTNKTCEVGCEHDHEHAQQTPLGKGLGYFLLLLPILGVFLIPTASLDANIVSAKGFHFPVSKDSRSGGDIEQQYLKPNTSIFFNEEEYQERMNKELGDYQKKKVIELTDDNFLQGVELIYNYPQEFEGKTVKFKGFVYRDEVDEATNLFIFRFGILHCVADSGVFGMLVNVDDTKEQLANNQWITVEGKIGMEFYKPFKQMIPMVEPTKIKKVGKPNNEYVYRKFD